MFRVAVGSKLRLNRGLTGPKAASMSIRRLGSTPVTRIVCSRTLPITGCRMRNVVPARSGPSVTLTMDSTFGSVRATLCSRSRKKPKTGSTGRLISITDCIATAAPPSGTVIGWLTIRKFFGETSSLVRWWENDLRDLVW